MPSIDKTEPFNSEKSQAPGDERAANTQQTQLSAAHHPIRRLMFFQLKLAADALRDILLSPVSIIATILDLIGSRKGRNSYFELLMKFGRSTEQRINLFDQHQGQPQTLDNVLHQVEEVLKKEYKDGHIRAKTKNAIEAKLKLKN